MQTLLKVAVLLSAVALTVAEPPAPVCDGRWEIDHDVADSHNELKIEVKLQASGGDAHFNLVIKDEPYAPAGGEVIFDAWCIDYNRSIWAAEFEMDVFPAYDPDVHTDAVDFPDRLPALAWLINNRDVYDDYMDGGVDENGDPCVGEISWRDYQAAVWYVIDKYQGQDNNYYNSQTDAAFGRSECIAKGLAKAATDWLASTVDGTYELDCTKSDQLVPLLYVVDEGPDDTIMNQVLMSETNIHSITGFCVCIEDTASPTTSPTDSPDEDTASPTVPPTASPTAAPTESPDDTPTPTTPPGTQGDPHFKTHAGEMYDVSTKDLTGLSFVSLPGMMTYFSDTIFLFYTFLFFTVPWRL